jgi:hypothetical protein
MNGSIKAGESIYRQKPRSSPASAWRTPWPGPEARGYFRLISIFSGLSFAMSSGLTQKLVNWLRVGRPRMIPSSAARVSTARCLSTSTSVTRTPLSRFRAFCHVALRGSVSFSAEVKNRVSGEFAASCTSRCGLSGTWDEPLAASFPFVKLANYAGRERECGSKHQRGPGPAWMNPWGERRSQSASSGSPSSSSGSSPDGRTTISLPSDIVI